MKRVKLTVSYDGTGYRGWQMQPNGVTIEEVLNQTLSGLLNEKISVIGASRTDSGVHALGNVAVFDTENRMAADKICPALNQRLPQDIRIQRSEEVSPDWHPRKQNCVKTYEYKFLNRRIDQPVKRLYTHFCYFPMDVEKMQKAAGYLIGEHDFKSFCTVRTQVEETIRTIYSLNIDRDAEDVITISISGNGFLYNMVRIIAGTLMKAAIGAYPPEHVKEILEARDRTKAGPKLPAKGLTLLSLDYENELRDCIESENEHWHYVIDQSKTELEGNTYFSVLYCEDEEYERILSKMIHQVRRNGAMNIFIRDMEKKDRLQAGQKYGYYTIEKESSSHPGWLIARENAVCP